MPGKKRTKPSLHGTAAPAAAGVTVVPADSQTIVTEVAGAMDTAVAPPAPTAQAGPEREGNANGKRARNRKDKLKKFTFRLYRSEHEALLELKRAVSELTGSKVKKDALIRTSLHLMLTQTRGNVGAVLEKLNEPQG